MRTHTVTCPNCGKTWNLPTSKIRPKLHCSCGQVFKPHADSFTPAQRPSYATARMLADVLGWAGAASFLVGIVLAVVSIWQGKAEEFQRHTTTFAFGALALVTSSQVLRVLVDMANRLWETSATLQQMKKMSAPEQPDTGNGMESSEPPAPPPPRL